VVSTGCICRRPASGRRVCVLIGFERNSFALAPVPGIKGELLQVCVGGQPLFGGRLSPDVADGWANDKVWI
jgi:hypothetical protein